MADHVFFGKPDARQADTKIAVSRFRPRYRALDAAEKTLHDEIKTKAEELEALYDRVQAGTDGRYKSLALTKLEESIMYIIKDLTGDPRVDAEGKRLGVMILDHEKADYERRVRTGYVK